MKFFKCCFLGIGFFCSFLASAETLSQEKLFYETIKKVDMGGIALGYQNTQNMQKSVLDLVEYLQELNNLAGNHEYAMHVQIGLTVLNQFQAIATSNKKVGNLFVTKNYVYTGKKPTGLLAALAGKENKSFNYANAIPENAVIAIGFNRNFFEIWQCVKKIIVKNLGEQMTVLIDAQLGGSADAFFKSINGDIIAYMLFNKETNQIEPQLFAVIPDQNLKLTSLLKMHLRNNANEIYLPSSNATQETKPLLIFRENKVYFASSKSAFNYYKSTNNSQKNIWQNRAMQPFIQGMPRFGTGFFYMNFDGAKFNAIAPEVRNMKAKVYGVTTLDSTGYYSIFRTDTNMDSMANNVKMLKSLRAKQQPVDNQLLQVK